MLAGVVIAVFDRKRQPQDDLFFALLKLSRRRGNFIGKVGGTKAYTGTTKSGRFSGE